MKNIEKNISRSLKEITLAIVALGFIGCSSSSNNGPVVSGLKDVSGVYRTASDISSISSITSIEIKEGESAADLEVMILRNGLSNEEYTYFNNFGEVQWADSRFGRTINLKNFKEGLDSKNTYIDEVTSVDVCGDKVALDSKTMDFRYCLELQRLDGSLLADGHLVLEVFEFGIKVHTIKTEFTVFIKDRWFVDYFGEWTGQLTYKNGNAQGLSLETGNRLDVTFQPVTETQYILRPLDTNQTINLHNEVFILSPETRDMTELEENANPYINFVYVSSSDGARKIYFNSFVHSDGYIEGSVYLKINGVNSAFLGTYVLEQVR